jgi:hypothetical protein
MRFLPCEIDRCTRRLMLALEAADAFDVRAYASGLAEPERPAAERGADVTSSELGIPGRVGG